MGDFVFSPRTPLNIGMLDSCAMISSRELSGVKGAIAGATTGACATGAGAATAVGVTGSASGPLAGTTTGLDWGTPACW